MYVVNPQFCVIFFIVTCKVEFFSIYKLKISNQNCTQGISLVIYNKSFIDSVFFLNFLADSNEEDDIITLLLHHGANINALDAYKLTPLRYAAQKGSVPALTTLLKNKDIDVKVTFTCFILKRHQSVTWTIQRSFLAKCFSFLFLLAFKRKTLFYFWYLIIIATLNMSDRTAKKFLVFSV